MNELSLPRVGISACLLGQPVRHNGDHKRNDWLVDQLGKFVTWVPICPEMEMGLGTPRDTLRLIKAGVSVRMVVVKTGDDLTERAQATAKKIVSRPMDLDAFVFKKDSPSCGLERVKVYGKGGVPSKT